MSFWEENNGIYTTFCDIMIEVNPKEISGDCECEAFALNTTTSL